MFLSLNPDCDTTHRAIPALFPRRTACVRAVWLGRAVRRPSSTAVFRCLCPLPCCAAQPRALEAAAPTPRATSPFLWAAHVYLLSRLTSARTRATRAPRRTPTNEKRAQTEHQALFNNNKKEEKKVLLKVHTFFYFTLHSHVFFNLCLQKRTAFTKEKQLSALSCIPITKRKIKGRIL